MAELTNLETKLGEVIGLAMAAQSATEKVEKLTKDRTLVKQLKTMRQEAAKAEKRGTELAGTFDGKKSKIVAEARTVKKKGAEMMKTYLDRDADELDGFEFLTMAEAARSATGGSSTSSTRRHGTPVSASSSRQLAIQKRHLRDVMAASLTLASKEDPNAPA